MRTTLTLDDDVAIRLKAEARTAGKSFKQAVNDLLRLGLSVSGAKPSRVRLRNPPRDLRLKAGLSYDDVWGLLESVEGPEPR